MAPESNSSEASGTKGQLLEVLTFLFLIVPSMALSFYAVRQGRISFVLTAVATILRDLALVSLILYFLWRNRERVARIGWTARGAGREAALGLALSVILFYAAGIVELAFRRAGLSAPSTPTPGFLTVRGGLETALAVVLVVVVAVAEETIFRGYLILRFRAVTRSTAAALVLSAGIFALGHGYEGSAGVATIGVMGLILGIVYVWRGSLAAPVAMHFVQDLVTIVLLPFLARR